MKNKKKLNRSLWLRFDRLLSHDLLRQLAMLGVALLVALILSYLLLAFSNAEWEKFCQEKEINKWLLPIYLLIDSNALNNLYIGDIEDKKEAVHGWMLIASSVTFLIGAFIFNGIIIGLITNSIERRVKNHQEGFIHYLKSGHYIIMGYDEMVPSLIAHVFEKDKDAYVLVLSSADAVEIREKLLKSFSEKQLERIIINYGHRVSSDAYHDIHLETAEQVYIVGRRTNPAHDAINVECVDSICRYLKDSKQKPNRITCVFKDLDTYAAFKTSEIFKKKELEDIEFVPFNFYTCWAKQVFVKREYKDFDNPGTVYKYPSVFGNGITPNDERYVHLVFVGTTNFAVAFAMEAAHVLHFPNADKAKTRITFIDINADIEKDEFITRNRHFFEVQPYLYRDLSAIRDNNTKNPEPEYHNEYVLFEGDEAGFLDVEFEFIKGNVFSMQVQNEIKRWAHNHGQEQYLSIFLALADQRQNFVMGMNMPDEVYDNEVPLFIRQDRSDNFVTNLRNADIKDDKNKLTYSSVEQDNSLEQVRRNARYGELYPFGMNETAYSADEHSLKRAKLINYLYSTADYGKYKFTDLLLLDSKQKDEIWNDAEKEWKKLSVALKWSNLYNAYAIRTKLATLRAMRHLDIDDTSRDYQPLSDFEMEELAKVEHNRWSVEKLLMGFRKPLHHEDKYEHPEFARELQKNKKLFIHHDIRPYNKLDIVKELDKEFTRYIPWIMKMTEI